MKMRLTPSADIPKDRDRRYIALSHQWGKKKFLILTRQNLENFIYSGIPFNNLRRTFRNAIVATAKLGVRYIWIDSLCIIQGTRDQSEWHQEAASMTFVYRNAFVTFAASNSVNIDDSLYAVGTNDNFLVENLLTLSDDWRLSDLKRPGRDEYGTYCVLGSKGDEFDTGPQVIVATDCESPIMNRAWVIQEYLLAPRTIHFAYPVVWECREMTIKRMFSQLYTFPSNPTPKVWTTGLEGKDCFILWNQTVVKYSKCSSFLSQMIS